MRVAKTSGATLNLRTLGNPVMAGVTQKSVQMLAHVFFTTRVRAQLPRR